MAAATELGIFDCLSTEKPKTAGSIASELGLHADRTKRLLRILAGDGLLTEQTSSGTYVANEASELLSKTGRSSDQAKLRDGVRLELGPQVNAAWDHLENVLRGGEENGFERAHGVNFDRCLETDPDYAERFNGAMTQMTFFQTPATVEALQRSGVISQEDSSVCDVAGGHGLFLKAIVEAHPWVKGTVVEQEGVVKSAPREEGTVTFKAADMFDGSDLPAATVYTLKYILHDWDDVRAARILESIKRAAPSTGCKLIICEIVMPDDANEGGSAFAMDLQMMVCTGGRERSVSEYENLLNGAGFRFDRLLETGHPMKLVVASLPPKS